jgi:hypothetical protein
VRQTLHDLDTALLVRGTDTYGNFGTDIPATSNLEPQAMARRAEQDALIKGTYVRSME